MSDKEVSPSKKEKSSPIVSDDDEDVNIEAELKQLQKQKTAQEVATTPTVEAKSEDPVKQDYHESVINDVYNSMSDDSSEEEGEEKLADQITTEAKAKEEEIKRQKDAQLPIATKIQQQLRERVSQVHKIVVEKATKENIKGVNDKVRGMFT